MAQLWCGFETGKYPLNLSISPAPFLHQGPHHTATIMKRGRAGALRLSLWYRNNPTFAVRTPTSIKKAPR
jgi:hypothetical protein